MCFPLPKSLLNFSIDIWNGESESYHTRCQLLCFKSTSKEAIISHVRIPQPSPFSLFTHITLKCFLNVQCLHFDSSNIKQIDSWNDVQVIYLNSCSSWLRNIDNIYMQCYWIWDLTRDLGQKAKDTTSYYFYHMTACIVNLCYAYFGFRYLIFIIYGAK